MRTAAVLDGLPDLQDAFFSILAPRYQVPPHRGPTRAILRLVHASTYVQAPLKNMAAWNRARADKRYNNHRVDSAHHKTQKQMKEKSTQ